MLCACVLMTTIGTDDDNDADDAFDADMIH